MAWTGPTWRAWIFLNEHAELKASPRWIVDNNSCGSRLDQSTASPVRISLRARPPPAYSGKLGFHGDLSDVTSLRFFAGKARRRRD